MTQASRSCIARREKVDDLHRVERGARQVRVQRQVDARLPPPAARPTLHHQRGRQPTRRRERPAARRAQLERQQRVRFVQSTHLCAGPSGGSLGGHWVAPSGNGGGRAAREGAVGAAHLHRVQQQQGGAGRQVALKRCASGTPQKSSSGGRTAGGEGLGSGGRHHSRAGYSRAAVTWVR